LNNRAGCKSCSGDDDSDDVPTLKIREIVRVVIVSQHIHFFLTLWMLIANSPMAKTRRTAKAVILDSLWQSNLLFARTIFKSA
jgi:hypothetical protein